MTGTVTSKDGTTLTVDVFGSGGSGVPVILIGGAFNDRSTVAALAGALAPTLTAVTYDRRRRGGSDDRSADYAVRNEIEDLAALIGHLGGRASLFGHSSGGVLAIEAMLHGLPIDKVAVYETPYMAAEGDRPPPPDGLLDRLKALLAAGDLDGAVELFLLDSVGAPPETVAGMRAGEGWGFLVRQAASLPYDVLVTGDLRLPEERLAAATTPLLAVYGDQTWPWLAAATRAVAAAVPGAELVEIEGEDHGVLAHPEALAPTLTEFLG